MSDVVEVGEFKGKPLIIIPLGVEGKDYSVKFGLAKARAVLKHIPAIKAFVESEGKSVNAGDAGEDEDVPF